jgi:D-mannonate dehydratase
MVTETSAKADTQGRAHWMDETLDTVRSLRAAGIPVVGYTWFPLFTMIDWAYRTGRRRIQDYLLHLGLYESTFDGKGVLRRHKTPLIKRYQKHMAQPMTPILDL